MRIFCVQCKRWYAIADLRDGVKTVTDKYGITRRGDLHTCTGCGNKVVADFGAHYHADSEPDYHVETEY